MSLVTTRSWPFGTDRIAASSVRPNAPGSFADNGANSFAIIANSDSRRGALELGLVIGRRLAEFRGALLAREPVQNRVHEARFVAVEKIARELDIFVDHDFGRNVPPRH